MAVLISAVLFEADSYESEIHTKKLERQPVFIIMLSLVSFFKGEKILSLTKCAHTTKFTF